MSTPPLPLGTWSTISFPSFHVGPAFLPVPSMIPLSFPVPRALRAPPLHPAPRPGPPSPPIRLGRRGCCGEIFWLELNRLPVAVLELGLFLEMTLLVLAPVVYCFHVRAKSRPVFPSEDLSETESGVRTRTSPFQTRGLCVWIHSPVGVF